MNVQVSLTRTVDVDTPAEEVALDLVREHFARRAAELLHLAVNAAHEREGESHMVTVHFDGPEETMLEFLRRMREAKVVGFNCYTSDSREAGLLATLDPLPVVEVERFEIDVADD